MKKKLPPALLWLLLSLPAAFLVWRGARGEAADLEDLLQPTGEMSVRLIILALAVTPLVRLFPKAWAVRWLLRHRRAIGVAAFGYALLHTFFYLLAMGSIDDMIAELGATGIWTGWVAFALMLPVAVTSNDMAQRALRSGWKRVQKLVYPVAMFTLVHWIFVHGGATSALLHFAPLLILQVLRIARRPKATATTHGDFHA